jgi:hypothetical protein
VPLSSAVPAVGRALTHGGTPANRSVVRASPVAHESFVATRPVAAIVKKSCWGLPSRPHQLPVALVFAGCGPAPGNAGFGRSVSFCLPLSPGIVAAPCAGPISALLPGSLGCNSAGEPAGDESVARILSADTIACAVGVLNACADPVDFPDDL